MKKFLLLIGCCVATVAAVAQEPLTATEDFDARFARHSKAYAQSPEDVEALYNLAQFYFDNSNPMRNLPVAMGYILKAEKRHVWLIENDKNSELRRLLRSNITIATIRQLKHSIYEAALNTVNARTDMSMEEIDSYLDAFGFDPNLVSRLQQQRIDRIYEEDLRQGTAESYYHYIDLYPGTRESELMEGRLAKLAPGLFADVISEEEADAVAARFPLSPSVQRALQSKKSSLAFAVADGQNSMAAYKEFLDRYPSSNESQQARERLEKMLEGLYVECKTAMDYAVFANTYPDLSLADKALAQARRLIAEQHDVAAARYYLQKFPLDPSRDEVYKLYYSWHAAEGNGEPLQRFVAENPDYPYQRVVEDDLQTAAAIDRVNLLSDFLEEEYPRYADHVRKMTGKDIAIVPLKRMIQGLVDARNYHAALERVRKFELSFENVPEYQELLGVLSAPATGRKAVREFAETYSVMNPAVNPSDGRLYYTRVVGDSRQICFAVRDGRQWLPMGTVPFDGPVANDGLTLFGFYDGGSRMLLGADGNIMMAEREDSIWRVTDIPPYPVNTDYVETDAYMLPDGSGLLLASDRPGGHNLQTSGTYFHGDTALATDLYFIPYKGGSWGSAVNLGCTVNTPYSERSPILSRNLMTLYFVTDGRGGLGFGDVYMATRSNPVDWTSWSTPKNVGKEINSGHNEAGLSFSSDEKTIYMAVNSALGTYACYSFPTAHSTVSTAETCTLDLLGAENALLRVRVADLEQQAVTQVVDCSGDETSVTLNVHRDRRYAVIGDAGLLFVPAVVFVAGSQERQSLRGYTFADLVRMDRPLPLEAVSFDTQATVLTPVAQLQLAQLARFLQHHPSAVAEFCIDVVGMDDIQCYNRSVEQGVAIRDFLTLNGIDASRVIVSPYGNVNTKKQGRPGVSVRFRETRR
ncbi:MAG: hypothetical protein J6X59_07260 [Bacteroidales bacterium]|nr:hypothetical protein [Bacteroidales bacterium]